MSSASSSPAPFVRLDFAGAPGVLTDFDELLVATQLAQVRPCLARAAAAWQAGHTVVGFLAYEAAPALDPAMVVRTPTAASAPLTPLLWLGISARPAAAPDGIALPAVARGAPLPAGAPPYTLAAWAPQVSRAAYLATFATLQQHLRDGATYQVNYTFPLRSAFRGDVGALYADLRRAQRAPYAAWLHTPEWDILSASPELFFTLADGVLTTRPMKGTRRRAPTPEQDAATAAELLASPKERAENVMIVDLLRNDLGRVAVTGSVQVADLCTLERYPTVWQMTSTVRARLAPGTDLLTLLGALFPCGSITGAPKVHTMRLIAAAETLARGVYCGSLLHLAPGGRLTASVAIRTLVLAADGAAHYAVGSGVVAGASGADEYRECLDKAAVLHAASWPEFQLLETLRWDPATGYALNDAHLARLAHSAAYFDYPCDLPIITAALAAAACAWTTPQRVRLLLARAGTPTITATPLPPAPVPQAPYRVRLARTPVDPADVFLYHKTTHRAVYAQAAAERGDADDVLLCNTRGEVTESTIANLLVELPDGTLVTPPLSSGLLPGTGRAARLAAGTVVERVVTPADLRTARALYLLNSVRGAWPVTLLPD